MPSPSLSYVRYWLFTGCFLIFFMVILGGITRLTGSGLSITEWNVIMGTLPPLSELQWNDAFEKYKQIPQFRQLNYDYTLGDFKKIFFWEYLHRLIGRLIGVVFLVPFLFFLRRKWLSPALIRKALFLFALGGLQGFLGWFMVQSGLSERTSVSHIRLAIHLSAALLTFAFTWWFFLDLREDRDGDPPDRRLQHPVAVLLAIAGCQVIYGALTAGLHAGRIANTFPKMDGRWIPDGLDALSPGWMNATDNLLAVQFIHRSLAFLLLAGTLTLLLVSRKMQLSASQRRGMRVLALLVALQFLLGVITLLTHVSIVPAVLHQSGAFFVVAALLFVLHPGPAISSGATPPGGPRRP
jgi:cytochrome c oxidase assembly protein subunit 15